MTNEDIVELGVASEETKGIGQLQQDVPLGQPQTGILDD
jgi:hypothetical protein